MLAAGSTSVTTGNDLLRPPTSASLGPTISRCRRALFLFALLSFAIWALLPLYRGETIATLKPDRIVHVSGLSYIAKPRFPLLPGLQVRQFDPSSDRPSQLTLYESGIRLGPSHSLHADIGTFGSGSYSHWGKVLYFSSSDGSDPRTNARVYTVTAPTEPDARLLVFAILAATLGALCSPAPRRLITSSIAKARDLRLPDARLRQPGVGHASIALALLCLATLWVLDVLRPVATVSLDNEKMRHFHADVYFAVPRFETFALYRLPPPQLGACSKPTILFEDQAPLKRIDAHPAALMTAAAGSFCLWSDGVVYLSTSNNSDPTLNGKVYVLSVRSQVRPSLAALLVFATTAAAITALTITKARKQWTPGSLFANQSLPFWIFATVCIGLLFSVNHVFMQTGALPLWAPDSATYLEFSVTRTVGLGLVYKALIALGFEWSYLPLLQANVIALALCVLGWAIGRLAGTYWLAALSMLVLSQLESIYSFAPAILTEWLFVAVWALHLASTFTFIRTSSWVSAIAVGITLGALLLIKSVAAVLVIPLILLSIISETRQRRGMLFALIIAVAVGMAPALWTYAATGRVQSSPLGQFALAGHVSWLMPTSSYAPDADLAQRLQPRIRHAMEPVPDCETLQEHVRRTTNEYNLLLWRVMVPEVCAWMTEHYPIERMEHLGLLDCRLSDATDAGQREIARLLGSLALDTIADQPSGYARHVSAHFLYMWATAFDAVPLGAALRPGTPGEIAELREKIQAIGGRFDAARFSPQTVVAAQHLADQDFQLSRLREALFGDLGVVATLAMRGALGWFLLGLSLIATGSIFVRQQRSPQQRALFYAAASINAYCLGHALFQVYLPRYALVIQPAAIAMLMCAIAMVLARWRDRIAG